MAHQLGETAAKLALSYFRKGLEAEAKADGTPVTQVDLEVEKTLRNILMKERPEDAILGKEFGEEQGASRRWIIDPIDGTSEYLKGSDYWGTHIALEEDGELTVGLITRPSLNRRWWASRNGGAFYGISSNMETAPPVALSSTQTLSESKVTIWERSDTERVKQLIEMGVWVTPSLANIIGFLEGEIDAFVDVQGKPWDHAPVALITREAGGNFRDYQGTRRIDIGEVCYSNGRFDPELYAILYNR